MAIGILEVDSAAAVVPVDLADATLEGIGPVLELTLSVRPKISLKSSSPIGKA